jgi:mRNA interferase HicA
MRLLDFQKHLKKYECTIVREGGNHTIYHNSLNRKNVPVHRHREIKNQLVKKICKQLEIPSPFD